MARSRDPEAVEQGRRRVIEAGERLLAGAPRHAQPGRLSALALADEAGIDRNRLNREYTPERDEFLRHAKAAKPAAAPPAPPARATGRPEGPDDARAEDPAAGLRRERDNWKKAAQQFVRIINAKEVELASVEATLATVRRRAERLETENRQLREDGLRLAAEHATAEGVVTLRPGGSRSR